MKGGQKVLFGEGPVLVQTDLLERKFQQCGDNRTELEKEEKDKGGRDTLLEQTIAVRQKWGS